jgi:glutamate racemase
MKTRPIGVFDSGLGGLTVLRSLHRRLPCEDMVYFGDTARVPYGTKGEMTVRAFARQDAGLLVEKGVKMVVVACNTASAFALEHLRQALPVPVLGVIEPGVAAALQVTRGGVVGVIGTSGTIRSGRYQEGLRAGGLDDGQIMAVECPLFVPLVEEDKMGQALMKLAVQEYLQPLKDAGVDTLILGCTHYPLLKEDIGSFMGAETLLVDSAEMLAEAAVVLLRQENLLRRDGASAEESSREGELSFFLSDLPWKFSQIGERFLGRPIANAKIVGLDEMEAAGNKHEGDRP